MILRSGATLHHLYSTPGVLACLAAAALLDLATPPAWAGAMALIVPLILVSGHRSRRLRGAVFLTAALVVVCDWVVSSWPLLTGIEGLVNASLGMAAVGAVALLGERRPFQSFRAEQVPAMLEFAPNPAVLLDAANRVRGANARALDILGCSLERARGATLDELVPLADGERWSLAAAGSMRLQPAGRDQLLEANWSPTPVADERWTMLTVADVTEQQRAEETLQDELKHQRTRSRERDAQLTALLDNAPALIGIKDRQGRYVAINSYLAEKWRANPEHFVGRTDPELAEDEAYGRELHDNDLALMAENRVQSGEEEFRRLPGETFYVTRFPITDRAGEVIGLGAIGIDMTPLQRARELADARKRSLERSNADLERYARMAAHDLQEPVRTIAGLAELLSEGLGELTSENAELLALIRTNAERGRALVADLLGYAKLDAAGSREAVDLNAVARRAAGLVQGRYPAVRVELADLPTVEGNAAQLATLFEQLLDNGAKFNTADDPLVRITCVEREGGWRLQVRDNGPGFAPEHADRVFEIFTRLKDRDAFTGTGVGLAMCRRIVELHGGTMTAESAPGEGAVFTCDLPGRGAAPAAVPLAAGSAG